MLLWFVKVTTETNEMATTFAFLALIAIVPNVYGSCDDSSSHCPDWKRAGYCKKDSPFYDWMSQNCKSSCGSCLPPSGGADCSDAMGSCYVYKSYCNHENYVSYLRKYCKKTCNLCHLTTVPPKTTTTASVVLPSNAGTLQPGCGRKGPGHTRIVGGTAAKPGDWPWIVTFDYKYNTANPGHLCGGTLITNEWILSAAHCFHHDQDKSNYWLVLGEHDLKTTSRHEQKIPIAEIKLHPKYNPSNYDNDLALVRLSRKASINDRVKTACLPDQGTDFGTGTNCYIAGWGYLKEYGRGPQILQQAQVPLVDHKVCKQAFPYHTVSRNMICAGYAAGGIDSCQGDSGGPLVCKRADDTWFLWGVVSWGVGCGRKNKFGVYAKTTVLREWVDSVVFS